MTLSIMDFGCTTSTKQPHVITSLPCHSTPQVIHQQVSMLETKQHCMTQGQPKRHPCTGPILRHPLTKAVGDTCIPRMAKKSDPLTGCHAAANRPSAPLLPTILLTAALQLPHDKAGPMTSTIAQRTSTSSQPNYTNQSPRLIECTHGAAVNP